MKKRAISSPINPSLIILLIAVAVMAFSCKKDPIDTSGDLRLGFSEDTVFFDTVFTSIGSITQYLTVHNPSKERVRISSIRLAGGNASYFRINIDGDPVTEGHDIEIEGEDSLYIFIRVTIDPADSRNPFIVTDSIVFETNGNIQDVDLVAWGQDANYVLADTYIPGFPKFRIVAGEYEEVTWKAGKPYVIYGYAVVDSNGVLEIQRGTQVHFHDNSGLWIYKGGQLKVLGALDAPVVFQGDRLEGFYRDLPGQWDRIWINEGIKDNIIDHAIIRNGFIGIQAETLQERTGNKLILSNTRIENMTGLGLLTRYYDVTGYNDVVVNCGQYLAAFTWGGNYDFRHCTFANYWSESVRVNASIILNNYFADEEDNIYAFDMNAYFGNSILDGRNDDELELSSDPSASFDFLIDHCILKTRLDLSDQQHYKNVLPNVDSIFADYLNNNYQLDTLSPAINQGDEGIINSSILDLGRDILEVNRTVSPDLGAYEFVPERD